MFIIVKMKMKLGVIFFPIYNESSLLLVDVGTLPSSVSRGVCVFCAFTENPVAGFHLLPSCMVCIDPRSPCVMLLVAFLSKAQCFTTCTKPIRL